MARRVGHRVILAARKLGAILRPLGDVIVLMPPLCITPEELETLARITYEAIDRGAELEGLQGSLGRRAGVSNPLQ